MNRRTLQPWDEMRRLQQEMLSLLGGVDPALGQYPAINVTRGQKITLEALCPGVQRDDLEVTVMGDSVTLRGERKPEPDVPAERYTLRERPVGAFTRTLSLGDRLDPDQANVTYQHGILRVELSLAPEATPKKIPIQN